MFKRLKYRWSLMQEQQLPQEWWYLSFASDEIGFAGAIIVYDHGFYSAMQQCYHRGIAPQGCEIMGREMFPRDVPPPHYRNRLLTREEINQFWPDAKTMREWENENQHT